jgi:Holliday junction resolvasome RuvABC ATP-dependent DNA helicase subunit
MVREKRFGSRLAEDDDDDHSLRPQRLKEVIGQRDVAERLRIGVEAAKKRGDAMGHISSSTARRGSGRPP